MPDERRELFSAARDEGGALEIHFPDSDIVIKPKKKFWKEALRTIERSLKGEDKDLFEKLMSVEEVVEIIKKCLENW